MNRLLDIGAVFTIVTTFALFAIAAITHGFTHDLLLESAVFLISLKLIIGSAQHTIEQRKIAKRLESIENLLGENLPGESLSQKCTPPAGEQAPRRASA